MKTKAPHFPDEKKVCQNEAAQLVTELWKIIKLGEKKTTSLKKNQVRYDLSSISLCFTFFFFNDKIDLGPFQSLL